ncbi:MAG: hypothetical protein HY717_21410 [Planctomycetes bacterium]|nr:hypothetical protein [Planctomycetota bacterium]
MKLQFRDGASCLPLAALGLLALIGCRPAPRAGKIDENSVYFEVGTGGLSEEGRWNLVKVTARAEAGIFEGEVEVSGRDSGGRPAPESFKREFSASAAPQAVEIPILPRGWEEVVVAFRGGGFLQQFKKQGDWPVSNACRILAVSDGPFLPGALAEACRAWLGLEQNQQIALRTLPPRQLPEHFLGYDVADLVILNGASLADSDPDRVEALLEWVRRGGAIAAVPGPSWAGKLPQALLQLFGLAENPQPLAPDPETEERLKMVLELPAEARLPGGFYHLELLPGALAHQGLFLENRFGSGKAFLFSFAPERDWLSKDPGGSFQPGGLARAWQRIFLQSHLRPRPFSGKIAQQVESSAIQALTRFAGFRYPSGIAVLFFVAGYLGIGFVALGWFFHRRKRLERMYLAALALAVLSSFGIYRFGLLSGISSLRADAVVLAVARPGAAEAEAVSWIAISSPNRRTIRPRFPEGISSRVIASQPLPREEAEEAFSSQRVRFQVGQPKGPLQLLEQEYAFRGQSMQLPPLLIHPNATRYCRFNHPHDLGGELQAQWIADPGGEKKIEVTNGTRFSLRLYLLVGRELKKEISLKAGEKGTIAEEGAAAARTAGIRSGLGDSPISMEITAELEAAVFEILKKSQPEERQDLLRLESSRFLIAITADPLFSEEVFGPIGHSVGFFLLELGEPEED